MMKNVHIAVVAIIACVAPPALSQAVNSGIPMQTIVVQGDPNPAAPTETLEVFAWPSINQSGVVGFLARTRIDPSSVLDAIFLHEDGAIVEVMREGEPLANHPILTSIELRSPFLDDTGAIAFVAKYSTSSGSNGYIYGPPDDLRLVVLTGFFHAEQDPDPPYLLNPGSVSSLRLTRNGTMGFTVRINVNVNTVLVGRPNEFDTVARSFMSAPGFPGESLRHLGFGYLDQSGRLVDLVVFEDDSTRRAILRAGGSGERFLPLAEGSPVPGIDALWFGTNTPHLNGAGVLAFTAPFSDSSSPSGFTRGLFVGQEDALECIAKTGDPAPGLPEPYAFLFSDELPTVVSNGDLFLISEARADGLPTLEGIWRWRNREFNLLAETGDHVSNLPEEFTFRRIGDLTTGRKSLAVNAQGRAVFIGELMKEDGSFVVALLTVSEVGALTALGIEGEPFEVAPDDVRIVREFQMVNGGADNNPLGTTGDDGKPTSLNEAGAFVCMIEFEGVGGSGGTSGVFQFDLGCDCFADVECDGEIGVTDLMSLLNNWGTCPAFCAPDSNTDGAVDVEDLLALLNAWGPCSE